MSTIMVREGRTIRAIITDADIRAGWADANGQGNRQARERGPWCVTIGCDEEDALKLSRAFYESVFAVTSCAYYDSHGLSLYCGDAGQGAPRCRDKATALVAQLDAHGSPLRRVIGGEFDLAAAEENTRLRAVVEAAKVLDRTHAKRCYCVTCDNFNTALAALDAK